MDKYSFGHKLAEAGFELYKVKGDTYAKEFMTREMKLNSLKTWECAAIANFYKVLKQDMDDIKER